MKQVFLFFTILICYTFKARAAEPVWTNYSSHNNVKSMYEADGSMWIASLGGLVKYDITSGKKTYFSKANGGLPSNTVEDITVDLANNIWIGTYDAGIAMYDGSKWKSFNTENSKLPDNAVRAVAADKLGNVYIGTGDGLVVIKDNNWKIYNSKNTPSFHSTDVWALEVDENNGLWIGAAHGVYYMQNSLFTDYSEGLPLYGVNDIDYNKTLGVIATGHGGAFKLDAESNKWIALGDMRELQDMSSAMYAQVDTENNLWVTTFGATYKYNGENWSAFKNGKIAALCLDRKGMLWGAGETGISRLVNNQWQHVTALTNTIAENYVRNITPDKKGNVWINTNSGVTRYNKNGWAYFNKNNSKLPSDYIARVRTDKNGNPWFATDKGLTQLVDDKWIIFDLESSELPAEDFKDVGFDSKGNIWAVHEKGISIIDTKEWKHIENPSSFKANERFVSIAIAADDIVWLGTGQGNIYRYANNNWKRYSFDDKTFAGGYVMDMKIDARTNKVWAGTWGGGLSYFDGEKWNEYATGQPIIVSAHLIDSENNLWTGSMYPSTLKKTDKKGESVIFDWKNSPIPTGNITALEEDEHGNIWIGTTEGVLVYSTKESASIENTKKHNNTGFGNLFPNPATTQTTLAFTLGKSSQVQINITDIAGKTITSLPVQHLTAGEQNMKIETDQLPNGTYIITLRSDNMLINHKLVVNR